MVSLEGGRPGFRGPSSASLLLLLLVAVRSCSAAMAAWWTTIGPQLMRQNATSGDIMYSLCNSNDTPIYPVQPPTFGLQYKPRNGTSMSARGWWNEKTTFASIFYQGVNGDIVNSFHECNWRTGRFMKRSDVIISKDAPKPHITTGLAVVNLGAKDGYRVFYHDLKKVIHVIGYQPKDSTWYYAGVVSKDAPAGLALAANHPDSSNVTVVYARDASNIGVSRINENGNWQLSSFPRPLVGNFSALTNNTNTTDIRLDAQATPNFTLPGWDGNPGAMGVAIDMALTRSVFWIGPDKALHQAANRNFQWQPAGTNLTRAVWPLADSATADFAVTSDFGSSVVRIYYDVGGNLTQLSQQGNGLWTAAQALPAFNATAPPPANPTTATGGADDGANPTNTDPAANTNSAAPAAATAELSMGAKAGIGVGVAFGVLGVAGAAFGIWLMRRRQAAAARAVAEAEAEEEEKHRLNAVAAAAHGQHPQHHQYAQYPGQPGYYYDNGGNGTVHAAAASSNYPASYGSPPPPATPFSDNGSAGQMWSAEKAADGPPQELHSRSAAYELPEQRQTLEMEGWRGGAPTPHYRPVPRQ